MDLKKFTDDYSRFLKQNSDPQRAVQERRYLYSDLSHYGVSVWARREFVHQHLVKIASLSKQQALELTKQQWSKKYFEEKALALDILEIHADKLDITDMPLIEKMMRQSKGWAFLDELIIPLMPALLTKDKRAYLYLKKWIKEDDFWVRRSALLAQLLFFRNGNGGDRDLFFRMAKSQFDEGWIDKVYKDKLTNKRAKFFIRKAIGWSLREMSAKDGQTVFEFLRKNRSKMSGLSFREGSRKLPEDLKAKL